MTQIHTHPQAKKRNKWCFYFIFFSLKKNCNNNASFNVGSCGVGMAMGRGGAKGWGLHPRPAWFYLAPSSPRPAPPRITGKTFSPHPRPLGPYEAPPHPVKLYFLLICPTTNTIFLMKPISLIKIYLKLQLNLSHQIKSIFRKNWIIYPNV